MDKTATLTIGLDTPISLLTPRQLFEMMNEWQATQPKAADETQHRARTEKWYARSVAEMAEILGTSPSTVYRMKADGLLDDCISQFGKWMMIDVEKVIEKFKLSNHRKRRRG